MKKHYLLILFSLFLVTTNFIRGFEQQVENATLTLLSKVNYTMKSTQKFLRTAQFYDNNPIGVYTLSRHENVPDATEHLQNSINHYIKCIDYDLFYVEQFIRCNSPHKKELKTALAELTSQKEVLFAKNMALQEQEQQALLLESHCERHKNNTPYN
jgi:hypothetical protein